MNQRIQKAEREIIPIYHAKGSNYEIGYNIGYAAKNRIIAAGNQPIVHLAVEHFDEIMPGWYNESLKFAKKYYPLYVEEIQGLAEGAGYAFKEIFIRNLLICTEFGEKCSSVIIKTPKNIIMAHNEDALFELGDYAYISDFILENGTRIIGYCYPGALPGGAFGCNNHGLAFCGNEMPHYQERCDVPRIFNDRHLLEAASISETLDTIKFRRSVGFNHNIISLNENRAINIEYTRNKYELLDIKEKFFHTNHYLNPKFSHIHIPTLEENSTTLSRYQRGQSLLANMKNSIIDVLDFLSDPLIHRPKTQFDLPRVGTIHGGTLCTISFQCDIEERKMKAWLFSSEKEKTEYVSLIE